MTESKTQSQELMLTPGFTFMANGKEYTVSETFSIGRFEKVEEMEEELMQFSDKNSCHKVMLAAMKKINEMNPGEAYMLLYNKIDTDQRNAKMIHYIIRLCTAYINVKGEDVKYLTEEMIKSKIHDWSEEGLDIRPFLLFAVSVCQQLFVTYNKPIQSILEETVKLKENIEKVLDIRTLIKAETGQEIP